VKQLVFCQEAPSSDPWVEVGPQIGPATLPQLVRLSLGSGDVRIRRWHDASERPLVDDAEAPFELAQGLAPCEPERTTSGAWVCVPEDAEELFGGSVWFADDACTEHVFDVREPGVTVLLERGDGLCTGDDDRGIAAAWSLTGTYDGPLFVQAGVTCVPSGASTQPGQPWRRGTEAPPTTAFPALTRATR
jgi:hypothetical protein